MLITFGEEKEYQIRGDAVVNSILRSSLEPIPVTFEATIRLDSEQAAEALQEGKDIYVGRDLTKIRIIYARNINTAIIQSGQIILREIIGILHQAHQVGYKQERAIILRPATMSEVYASCGAKVNVTKDLKTDRFYCYQGQTPTKNIAQALQSEGASIVFRFESQSIEFIRNEDLFKQEPKITTYTLEEETVKSGFLERHGVPAYISTKEDGSIDQGDFTKTRAVTFTPLKNKSQLYNMSQVLINAKEIETEYAPDLNAGDLLTIKSTNYIIITAAHESGLGHSNQHELRSKFWLGVKSS